GHPAPAVLALESDRDPDLAQRRGEPTQGFRQDRRALRPAFRLLLGFGCNSIESAYPSYLLVHLHKPLVAAPKQRSEWPLHHRLAIGAEVFLVHYLFVRLACFGLHSNLWPQ